MTKRTENPTPATQSSALTWWRYDVSAQQAACALMSLPARGLDAALGDDAWANPDGSCRVDPERLKARCAKDGLNPRELWKELKASGRWSVIEDGAWLLATFLLARRTDGAQFIEKKREAGKRSGERRREDAEKRRETAARKRAARDAQTLRTRVQVCSDVAPESLGNGTDDTECNPFDDNDFEHTRTRVQPEHKTVHTTTDLSSRDHVVVVPDVAAASHADGAAASSGGSVAPRAVPFVPSLVCTSLIEETALPVEGLDPVTAALAEDLASAGAEHRVDVPRALWRHVTQHGRRGPEGHVPLWTEIRALLRGEAGRDGWIPIDQAPAAIVCALHGSLAHKTPCIAPLLFRGIATATYLAMKDQPEADGRALAAALTLRFSAGARQASGYRLPHECTTPERLLGFTTKAGAA
jgi:hypothetical protein